MKRFSVLSLVVSCALIFSIAGFGCKKAEQSAEAPKQSELGFETVNGTLEKGGLGHILTSSEKDKSAVAVKKTDSSFQNVVIIKGKIKAALPLGTRNGYIVYGEGPSRLGQAGIRIGGMKYVVEGHYAEKKEVPAKFDPNKVFDIELTVNIKEKAVTLKVDGTEVKTKMNYRPKAVDYVGYAVANTKTEFSDLQVSGN